MGKYQKFLALYKQTFLFFYRQRAKKFACKSSLEVLGAWKQNKTSAPCWQTCKFSSTEFCVYWILFDLVTKFDSSIKDGRMVHKYDMIRLNFF